MNRIIAIINKQLKDTIKNKPILIQFILFPVLTYFFTEFVAKSTPDLPNNYFVSLYATIYVGMIPLVNMASIISEEREKKTLRMLIMSNVKPIEYLIGVGGYVLILCTLGSIAFGIIGEYQGIELLNFILVMIVGAVASLLLGGAVGIISKNQASATSLATPIAMVGAFVPMVALFNENFRVIADILYTQQLNYLMDNLASFNIKGFIIIGINMLVFAIIFIIAYRKTDLKD